MSGDDDIDRLYGVDPADFTALRAELTRAAKKRGDAAAAKSIAAARRPTLAAWVVNALVRADDTARGRLAELAEQLRAAHASMDGHRIRELSTAQRKLVDELVKTGFTATAQSRPPAALRDDVVDTLQAAVADPDVAARLGRLAKAERWSGFGEFGTSTSTVPASQTVIPDRPDQIQADVTAANELVASARADAAAAQGAADAATESLSERATTLATARRRYEKLLENLNTAQRILDTAAAEHAEAERAAQDGADALAAAASTLESAAAELDRLKAKRPAL